MVVEIRDWCQNVGECPNQPGGAAGEVCHLWLPRYYCDIIQVQNAAEYWTVLHFCIHPVSKSLTYVLQVVFKDQNYQLGTSVTIVYIIYYHMGVFVSDIVSARSSPYRPEPPGEGRYGLRGQIQGQIQAHPYDNNCIINVHVLWPSLTATKYLN